MTLGGVRRLPPLGAKGKPDLPPPTQTDPAPASTPPCLPSSVTGAPGHPSAPPRSRGSTLSPPQHACFPAIRTAALGLQAWKPTARGAHTRTSPAPHPHLTPPPAPQGPQRTPATRASPPGSGRSCTRGGRRGPGGGPARPQPFPPLAEPGWPPRSEGDCQARNVGQRWQLSVGEAAGAGDAPRRPQGQGRWAE